MKLEKSLIELAFESTPIKPSNTEKEMMPFLKDELYTLH